MKIAIYLPSLAGGGAEKLQVNLAGYFIDQGHQVDFVLDRAEGPLLAALPKGATVTGLGSKRVLQSLPRMVRYLKAQKPDILLSNLNHNNIIALWSGKLSRASTKVIVCQHNALSQEAKHAGGKHRLMPFLYRLFLPWAHGIVGVSKGMADDLSTITGIKRQAITVIYNGVVTPDFEQQAAQPITHPWFKSDSNSLPVFVAIGRLVAQKDYPTLLHAFAKLVHKRPARLVILGEGPLHAELESRATALNIADHVAFLGYQPNPLPYMRQADAVVLASSFEGFAIVLAEALACETKVVSTDCPEGPREILADGDYGKLVAVGDADALADAMLVTLNETVDTNKLKQRGNDFSIAVCGQSYLDLMNRIL